MVFLWKSKLKKLTVKLILSLFAIALSFSNAFSSGYEFDGIGVSQVLRGGDVSADEGDWSHIYWNPAGLAGASRQVGIELRPGRMNVTDGNSIKVGGSDNVFSKEHENSSFILGSGGVVIHLAEKDTLAFGFFTPLMNSVDFEDNNSLNPLYNKIDTKSFAGLVVANISHARKVNDRISFGYGLNVVNGLLDGETKLGFNAFPPYIPSAYDLKTEISGNGLGFEGVAGLKYIFNERWSVAAVFRTVSSVKIEGDARAYLNGVMAEKSDITFKVKQPPTSSVGALYKPNKKIKFSADFSQTWWNGFSNKITVKNPGVYLKSQPNTFDWRTSVKFRLGLERLVDESFSWLVGYAFDTPAIDKNSIDFSTAVDVPMHRFSAGVKKILSSWDLSCGILYGKGTRKESSVKYAL